MKKLLFMLMAAVSFTACNKGVDTTPPPAPPILDQTQTVYADEIEKKNAVRFTATQAWSAVVSDITTRATNNEVEWLQLSAYSGSAGEQSLSISLMPNFTGESRKVEIKIVCGQLTITIIVEQKATTQDNKAPQYKTVKKMNAFKDGKADGYIEFAYDNQQRVTSCKISNNDESRNESYTIIYSASQINVVASGEETTNYTYGLDQNGRITYVEQLFNSKLERGGYTYNAEGYLTDYVQGMEMSSASASPGEDPTYTYRYVYAQNTWNGPNIKTTIIDRGHQYPRAANYEYIDKLNNGLASIDLTGGYKGMDFILFKDGSFGKRNKNLIKRETGSFTRDWSYEFDKDGNLSKFSISNIEESDRWTEDYEIIYN